MNDYQTVVMLTVDIHVTSATELLECRPEMVETLQQLSHLPATTILVLSSQGSLYQTSIGAFFAPVPPRPMDNWDDMYF